MNKPWRCASVFALGAALGASAIAQETPASPNLSQDEVRAATATTLSETGQPRLDSNTVSVSQVRIVRLSQVRGQVQLDRQTGEKFGAAFVNLPIVAGARLQTLDGLAEVEFEDNSSLRLTPNSMIEFPVLGRDANGATSTAVKLVRGSLYVSLASGKPAGSYTINAGNETISPTPSSHLRLDLASSAAKLVVLKGDVAVSDASGTVMVDKKKSVSFDTASSAPPMPVHGDNASPYDKWDKNEADYHAVRSSFMSTGSSSAGSPYLYGGNDLSYYGTFNDIAGCGSLWRPYLVSASWSPYQSGVWTLYPGAGYSWVSPYPWGWTPYHSGSWEFCNGAGWGWRPDGAWSGLNNVAALRKTHSPLLPSPPKPNSASLVAVNVKSLPVSRPGADGSFVFAGESAGLGVPRAVFSNLGKISQNVAQRGSATTGFSDSQAERAMMPTARPVASASNRTAEAGGASASMSASSSAAHSSSSSSMAASHSSGPSSSASSGGGHH